LERVIPKHSFLLSLSVHGVGARRVETFGVVELSSAMEGPHRLSAQEAKAKAAECRGLAMRAHSREHQIMLYHMAETWERIAKTLAQDPRERSRIGQRLTRGLRYRPLLARSDI